MKIALIGAGNVASHLGRALKAGGCEMAGVLSRSEASAQELAGALGCVFTCDMEQLPSADVFLFSVTDTALPALAQAVAKRHADALFVHTAGAVGLEVLTDAVPHAAVLYPLQTFSKTRAVDVSKVPFFVEASDEVSLQMVENLAHSLSPLVFRADSRQRRLLHLAAVFANNFANHCYREAERLMLQAELPFSLLLPLIDETAAKVHELSPGEAQTGPAVRGDEGVMDAHLRLLDSEERRELYRLLSKMIRQDHLCDV